MRSVITKMLAYGCLVWLSILPSSSPAYLQETVQENKSFAELTPAKIKRKLTPYAIPDSHPMKKVLDSIFKKSRATQDPQTFAAAGFVTIRIQPGSFIRVAKHPLLPGYLVKVYLDTEQRQKENIPGWMWFIYRCQGARQISDLIQEKSFRYITVPKKYIYILPKNPSPPRTGGYTKHPAILLVERMNIGSEIRTANAWKHKITHRHLDELYCIFSRGYSSTYITNNVAYCGKGIFSCIDTEKPPRKHDLPKMGRYFNEDMRAYWNLLISTGGNL